MKRSLWVAAALAPLTFAAAPGLAQVTVSGTQTTPVSTSSGDITVTGSVTLTASPASSTTNQTAVTQSGAHAVTNSGTISSGENLNYSDTNGDNIKDSNNGVAGQYAAGANRYGVLIGATTQGTSLTNSGTVTVIGGNSAGLEIGSHGLSGALTNSGTINVTGGNLNLGGSLASTTGLNSNQVSYGILSLGPVGGGVSLTGSVTATGGNAQAVSLAGGVTGGVTVSGALSATGYRDTTAPYSASKVKTLYQPTTQAHINAEQAELQQGGPALNIGGNVTGGINITAADSTTSVTKGTVTSYGSAPAILIGASNAVSVTNASGASLSIGGAVTGAGTYQGINGTGIQIGGDNPLQVADNGAAAATLPALGSGAAPTGGGAFGAATLSNGIAISGSVAGTALNSNWTVGGVTTVGDNSATGLLIGSTGSVSSLTLNVVKTVSGSTTTYSPGSLTATVYSNSPNGIPTATALQINGSLPTLTNNGGTISATVQGLARTNANGASITTGGTIGTANAVVDTSGTLKNVYNYGTISAAVTPPAGTTLSTTGVTTTALDLRANTSGVTVYQGAYTGAPAKAGATPIVSSITGDILFGNTGAGTLDLESGTDTGAVAYGSSLSNQLFVNGGASLTGALSTTGGALAVTVGSAGAKGTLNDTGISTINTSTLYIGSSGKVLLTANPTGTATNPTTGYSSFNATGAINIANGAGIGLNFISKLTQGTSQTYTLVNTTGALNVNTSAVDTSFNGLLPYMYKGTLSSTASQLNLTVGIKTTAQMGMNQAEASAFDAVYQAFSTDSAVNTALLSKTNATDFHKLYDQFLPDYAGGPFESLAAGQQAVQRAQADAPIKLQSDEGRGWVEEIAFDNNHQNSGGGGYNGAGFGLVGGLESAHGDSAFGVTAAFLSTGVQDVAQTNLAALAASVIEAGVYWRAASDGLSINASLNGGFAFFDSRRLVYDPTQATVLDREAGARSNGALMSGAISVGYQYDMGRFFLRPELAADYIMLYESGYAESGGGKAVDLTVGSRMNQQASLRADLVLGANYGTTIHWRPELTLGWREVIAGGPANTNAYFTNGGAGGAAGTAFTLSPNFKDKGGLLARLGLRAGGNYADFTADAGGQIANGYQTYDARAVARFLF